MSIVNKCDSVYQMGRFIMLLGKCTKDPKMENDCTSVYVYACIYAYAHYILSHMNLGDNIKLCHERYMLLSNRPDEFQSLTHLYPVKICFIAFNCYIIWLLMPLLYTQYLYIISMCFKVTTEPYTFYLFYVFCALKELYNDFAISNAQFFNSSTMAGGRGSIITY